MNNIMESSQTKPHIKDSPKFLVVSSVIVPITVAVIGLAGVILPNVLNKESVAQTQETQLTQDNTKVGEEELAPDVRKDTFGYQDPNTTASIIKTLNMYPTLKGTGSEGDFEMQFLEGEYYLIGFTKENFDKNKDIFLTNKSAGDYKKVIGIKFSDVFNISVDEVKVEKKEERIGLKLQARNVKTDVSSH